MAKKENFDSFCHEDDSPMHRALNYGNIEDVEKLLREGDFLCNGEVGFRQNCMDYIMFNNEVSDRNNPHWTFLENFLTKHPTLVNMKLQGDLTLLMLNAHNMERMTFLLNLGADPHICENSNVKTKNPECYGGDTLYNKDESDCDKTECNGLNALGYAVYNNAELDCIKTLIALKVDVNMKGKLGETALMMSCKNSNVEIVKELISAGADVNAADENGKTVFMFAVHNKTSDVSAQITKEILKNCSNINAIDAQGRNALFYAAKTNSENVKILLELGIDPNVIDNEGWNALMNAANCGNFESVKLLLAANSDCNILNKSGKNMLTVAIDWFDISGNCKFGKADHCVLNYLIEAGCDVLANKHWEYQTPFYIYLYIILQGLNKYDIPNEQLLTLQYFCNAAVKSKNYNSMNQRFHPQEVFFDTFYLCDIENKNTDLLFNIILTSPLKNINMIWSLYPCYCLQTYLVNKYGSGITYNHAGFADFDVCHNFIGAFLSKKIVNFALFFKVRSYPCYDWDSDYEGFDWSDSPSQILMFDAKTVIQCLQKLIDYGFKMETPGCVSTLTSLMMYLCECENNNSYDCYESISYVPNSNHDNTILAYKFLQTSIVEVSKFLIEKGADPADRKLEFAEKSYQELSDELELPDALLVAVMTGKYVSVRLLLPYWSAPPFALLMFPVVTNLLCCPFDELYLVLSQGGPLPKGTIMYQKVCTFMETLPDSEAKTHFNEMHSGVPSLLFLSRTALRLSLRSGADLPQRLSDLVPPGLKDFVKMTPTEDMQF